MACLLLDSPHRDAPVAGPVDFSPARTHSNLMKRVKVARAANVSVDFYHFSPARTYSSLIKKVKVAGAANVVTTNNHSALTFYFANPSFEK